MIFLETLYSELLDEGRIPKLKSKTGAFYNFNTNIGGALVTPTLIYSSQSDSDNQFRDLCILHGLAMTQIITSLETYYSDVFSILVNNTAAFEVNSKNLGVFVTKNRLSNEFICKYSEYASLDFPLSSIVPKYFPLQEKNRIKVAFHLFELNPANNEHEWNHTFGNDNDSTVQKRHLFVHNGVQFTDFSIIENRMEDVKNRIKDAIVLVCDIETQIQLKNKLQKIKTLYPS